MKCLAQILPVVFIILALSGCSGPDLIGKWGMRVTNKKGATSVQDCYEFRDDHGLYMGNEPIGTWRINNGMLELQSAIAFNPTRAWVTVPFRWIDGDHIEFEGRQLERVEAEADQRAMVRMAIVGVLILVTAVASGPMLAVVCRAARRRKKARA